MLVLSRKVTEAIHIGSDVEIVITRIDRDTVRLGIKAPREVPILRRELVDANEREVATDEH